MGRRKWGAKPGPRKIDGNIFHWSGWAASAAESRKKAEALRKQGYRARVIRDKPSKVFTQAYNIYKMKV